VRVGVEGATVARTLLVIEDDIQIRRAVQSALSGSADRIVEAASGREGLALAASWRPDLVVLDLGLPDMPGITVCREIRSWGKMPLVVLTARHAEDEKVALLDAGADDYVTKPFSTKEFAARVRAQLRRALSSPIPADAVVSVGDLTVDLASRRVERSGESLHLTPIEFEILRCSLPRQDGRSLIVKSSMRYGGTPRGTPTNTCVSTSRTCAARSSTTRRRRGSS